MLQCYYVYNCLCKPKIMIDIVKQVASYDKSTISFVTRFIQFTVGYFQLHLLGGVQRLVESINCHLWRRITESSFKDTVKSFSSFRNKQKKCIKQCFLYVYLEIVFNTLSINLKKKTQILEKFSSVKINCNCIQYTVHKS